MAMFPINVDVVLLVKGVFDAVLKLEHHGAACIDESQVVFN